MKKETCLLKMRIVFFLLCMQTSIFAHAQYTQKNSFIRRAIVVYDKDDKGFYHKSEGQILETVKVGERIYAYDKRASNLYVMTYNGNYEISLTKDYAKIVKNNKSIPQLKEEELCAAIQQTNILLEERFKKLNEQHERELELARQKVIADSILTINKEKAVLAAVEKEKNEYRKSHQWRWVPINRVPLNCSTCDNITVEDSVYCIGIKNDSIYYYQHEELALGIRYIQLHESEIPQKLKEDDAFKYHIQVFKDSLESTKLDSDLIGLINSLSIKEAIQKVKRIAPYGYIEDWGWDDEFSVSFNFKYQNTNPKTIKYIELFWAIKNEVGDIRRTGRFSGTGPLKYLEAASWEWEHSSYYVSGDASNMIITKLIITYMDGKKKILTGNMIKFN